MINTRFLDGGSELFFDTMENNLGFRPNHWVLIHFDSFVKFVDDQGGGSCGNRHTLTKSTTTD